VESNSAHQLAYWTCAPTIIIIIIIQFQFRKNLCNTYILFSTINLPDTSLKFGIIIMYMVQSIILWIGRIVALLCTTVDMWSYEMVPCPLFSCPSKKQLHACSVLQKKVTVVKGSCLRAVEIENVTVLRKIRQIH
jgi:hypothetical protein